MIYTVGHSTRSLQEMTRLLQNYQITHLIDVRSMPRSRHTPQFNYDKLSDSLKDYGINYTHLSRLGGLRSTSKNSHNLGWRNLSFRGYADHMQTEEFKSGLDELLDIASQHQVAIMCAEVLPWRCHRSMIGDALLVRDIEVEHIFDNKNTKPGKLTSFAKVDHTKITYPAYE